MFHMFSSQGGSIYGLGGLGVFWYGVHDEFLSDEGIIQSIFLGGGGRLFIFAFAFTSRTLRCKLRRRVAIYQQHEKDQFKVKD